MTSKRATTCGRRRACSPREARTLRRSAVTLAVVLCASQALAQDHPGGILGFETPWWPEIRRECPAVFQKKAEDKDRWTVLETCAVYVMSDDPIHPVVQTIAPMTGAAGGLSGAWDLSHGRDQADVAARALVSDNLSWQFHAEYTVASRLWNYPARTPDRPRLDVYGTADELSSLAFYDIGPASSRASVRYTEHEFLAGVDYTTPVTEWLRLGGRLEFRRPSIQGDPNLDGSASFVHYDAIVQLHHPASPPHDADAMLDYHVYQDVSGSHSTFGQFTALLTWGRSLERLVRSDSGSRPSIVDRVFCHEAKIRTCDYGNINLRGRLAISNAFSHSAVPFYYQPTLGGTDLDGYDTLRGFADYRFRAPDDWLGQIEYGRTVWGPIGFLLFYDFGQISLSADRVRQDWGVGATLTMLNNIVLRAYLAFGSGEGLGSGVKLAQP